MAQLTAGYSVEPMDIETPVRHLDATMAMTEVRHSFTQFLSAG